MTGSDNSPAVDAVAAAGPFDAAKVARIKQALAAGTYTVDEALLAEKLIAADVTRRR